MATTVVSSLSNKVVKINAIGIRITYLLNVDYSEGRLILTGVPTQLRSCYLLVGE